MVSSLILRVERTVPCLLAILIFALSTGGGTARGGYTYQTRHTKQSPNVERSRHVAVKLGNGKVGIFAGFARSDVQLFDPLTEQFTTSQATQWFGDFQGASLPDGNAVLVDGMNDSIYDCVADQYKPTRNGYPAGCIRVPVLVPLPDQTIFICGGWNNDFDVCSACARFDAQTMRFTALALLVVPRVNHTAVLLDEHRVLVIGGFEDAPGDLGQASLNTLEMYDTQTGVSRLVQARLHYARYDHCSVRLPDRKVLILGGTCLPDVMPLCSTEIFDPNTGTLMDGPSLGLGRRGAQLAVMPSGRVAVIGGKDDSRVIELYCPQTGTFELADSLMVDPRSAYFTVTSLDSGEALVVGGRVNNGERVTRDAEILQEVSTDRWSPPPMTLASIRQSLSDPDPNVVNNTADWLVRLGPQVKPILATLLTDESLELRLLAIRVWKSIDEHEYPQVWCVELWNESSLEDTVWLTGFDCADYRNVGFPDPHFSDILWATEGATFTHLVVRFPTHISYKDKVRLFNLVGWTLIPKVILGDDLTSDELKTVPRG